jgi:altronate hydrolase
LIRLHERDNVAVAVKPLHPGDRVEGSGFAVTPIEPIATGHKVALAPIAAGGDVVKYGEIIGIATAAIAVGAHVHVHNVRSARLPGT